MTLLDPMLIIKEFGGAVGAVKYKKKTKCVINDGI